MAITEISQMQFINTPRSAYPIHPEILKVQNDGDTLYITLHDGLIYYLSVQSTDTYFWALNLDGSPTRRRVQKEQLFPDILMELLL